MQIDKTQANLGSILTNKAKHAAFRKILQGEKTQQTRGLIQP